LVLVKDAGYTLADIRGERSTEREVVPPTSFERFLGSLTPSAARRGVGVLAAAGLLTTVLTGALAGAVVCGILAVACYALSRFNPAPRTAVRTVTTPGMPVDEVIGRLVQHDEHEQMKNEEAEAQARKARRQRQGGGGP
jgi:hypothetical protein